MWMWFLRTDAGEVPSGFGLGLRRGLASKALEIC